MDRALTAYLVNIGEDEAAGQAVVNLRANPDESTRGAHIALRLDKSDLDLFGLFEGDQFEITIKKAEA